MKTAIEKMLLEEWKEEEEISWEEMIDPTSEHFDEQAFFNSIKEDPYNRENLVRKPKRKGSKNEYSRISK